MQCLLTGPWLLNSFKLTAFTAGDQTKMDRSFPPCTTEHVHQRRQNGCFRDGIQHSNRVWICCCSLMKSWLIMFILHIICTRPIGRLVSQFYSSLGCFYPSGTTGRVVSSNTAFIHYSLLFLEACTWVVSWKKHWNYWAGWNPSDHQQGWNPSDHQKVVLLSTTICVKMSWYVRIYDISTHRFPHQQLV